MTFVDQGQALIIRTENQVFVGVLHKSVFKSNVLQKVLIAKYFFDQLASDLLGAAVVQTFDFGNFPLVQFGQNGLLPTPLAEGMAARCYLQEIRFNAGHDADSTRRKQMVLLFWVLADPTEVVRLVGVKVMHSESVFISGIQIKELFDSRRIVLQLKGRDLD